MSKSATSPDAAIDAAIGDVLASRRDALDAVAHAARDAERAAGDAREAARRIAERAERRIRKVRAAFDAARTARIAEIDAEVRQHDDAHELTAADFTHVARAVETLCDELTGACDESPRRP